MVPLRKQRYAGIERVALVLHTSGRTSQRKLKRKGETFGRVLAASPQAYAIRYL